MEVLRGAAAVLYGLASGAVISTAVVAFISAVGLVPRLAQKTNTRAHIKLYEMAIALGGVFGVVAVLFDFTANMPHMISGLAL
ncbi:MAG: stage V sporulation protein AB, partial [Defluviitaleaceae bacterium]|nr:stage V sporulation protein AB [Defluviitaleaceae bacterium]